MLHVKIKKYREKAKLTPIEMAKKIGVSYSYYTRIEKPFHISKSLPSERILKRIANIVSSICKLDFDEVYKDMLISRTKVIVPVDLIDSVKSYRDIYMSSQFIEELKNSIGYTDPVSLSKTLGIPSDKIEKLIEGKPVFLYKEEVIKLAEHFGKPVNEYLLLAGYIPQPMFDFLSNQRKSEAFFRVVNKVSDKKFVEIMNIINEILNAAVNIKN